jgi:hypothetical protein
MLRRLFVPLLVAFLGTVSLAAADPIFPPGQRIGLEPPPGLTLSTHFVGFEDPERKVIITILDLPPRAYAEAETSLFAENRPGVTVKSREMIAFNSGIGTLVTGNVSANGVTVHKWLLLASTMTGELGNLAALINVEVPDAARAAYPDAVIRAALASVTFRPPPIAERLKLLPFKLDDLAGLRVMQVTPGGVILVDGPADDLIKQAYMVVEVGQGSPSEPDARARFARDLLSSAPVSDLSLTSSEPMRISGTPGYETRAQAKGLDGAPISVVQWLRFGTGGFLRIVGVAHTEDWNRLFTRFRAVRDGIDQR